jgi:hypothetical protein
VIIPFSLIIIGIIVFCIYQRKLKIESEDNKLKILKDKKKR